MKAKDMRKRDRTGSMLWSTIESESNKKIGARIRIGRRWQTYLNTNGSIRGDKTGVFYFSPASEPVQLHRKFPILNKNK